MIKDLPPYEEVFFTHYQRGEFEIDDTIFSLVIESKGKIKEYTGNEAENIKEYAEKVKELLKSGLKLVHWGQNAPNYGADHINSRYKELTNKDLELEYYNDINFSYYLIHNHGDDFIQHPRLDNLAILNKFTGISKTEKSNKTFSINRLKLITKIYHKAFAGTLKTNVTAADESVTPQPIYKLTDLITHPKASDVVDNLKIQYKNIKGKHLKLLLLVLQDLKLLPKERSAKRFHDACKHLFDWDISSYNAMNGYKFNDRTDRDEFDNMKKFIETITNAK